MEQVGRITSTERGKNITVLGTVSATGTFIPPMIIYPRVRMNPKLLVGSFPGTTATANPSGWIDSDLLVQFLANFIKCVGPKKELPVLLILDGYTSHKSLKVITMCRDNGIFMVTLPPHTSKRLLLCMALSRHTRDGQVHDKPSRGKHHSYTLGPIIREAYISPFTSRNIMRGFQQAVISPFNPDIFTDDDFIRACAVCSSGSPVPSSVEQPGPSNGQSSSSLVQFPARTKLSTDHTVSSPSEAHSYLREDLPVVGPEKAIKVTDISPLPKHKNKSAVKTGRKEDRSEEITGSPCEAALEIKDALKSKAKAHAKKALSLGKSPKTQRRNNVPENPSREDDDATFCIYSSLVICAGINVSHPMRL
jgi:hypothetical protein